MTHRHREKTRKKIGRASFEAHPAFARCSPGSAREISLRVPLLYSFLQPGDLATEAGTQFQGSFVKRLLDRFGPKVQLVAGGAALEAAEGVLGEIGGKHAVAA